MTRPVVPDAKPGVLNNLGREPWEYEAELAKYRAIDDFLKRSGDLSDTTDTFKGFEAKWQAINQTMGYNCAIRLACYRNFRRISPDRNRMSRNEAVRLLTQPRIVVHGTDLLSPEIKEPGFWASVANGIKRMIGLKPAEPQEAANNAPHY
jgi:hypothetical protein